jgi:hypothetical protein
VGLQQGPLSLVSSNEKLLGRNNSGFGQESRGYDHGDSLLLPRDTLYPKKLAPSLPTSGGCLVGIVRSWTKATEFFLFFILERCKRLAHERTVGNRVCIGIKLPILVGLSVGAKS